MNKRQFFGRMTGLLMAGAVSGSQARKPDADQANAQTILTVAGAITHVNRARLNPVTDQLMHKHGIEFERAYTFTLADILKLSRQTIYPTMEYDERAHQLSGTRLLDVLVQVGAQLSESTRIVLHGIDGYSPEISLKLVKQYNYILATHMDGELLAIGGFGPLFAIYDADHISEFSAKPLNQRFAQCPWGLYCMEVRNS